MLERGLVGLAAGSKRAERRERANQVGGHWVGGGDRASTCSQITPGGLRTCALAHRKHRQDGTDLASLGEK